MIRTGGRGCHRSNSKRGFMERDPPESEDCMEKTESNTTTLFHGI